MVTIPYPEVIGTCAASSIIMAVYQQEPHHMSSLLHKIMDRIIGSY